MYLASKSWSNIEIPYGKYMCLSKGIKPVSFISEWIQKENKSNFQKQQIGKIRDNDYFGEILNI